MYYSCTDSDRSIFHSSIQGVAIIQSSGMLPAAQIGYARKIVLWLYAHEVIEVNPAYVHASFTIWYTPSLASIAWRALVCGVPKAGIGREWAQSYEMVSPFADITVEDRCCFPSPVVRKVCNSADFMLPCAVLGRIIGWRMNIDIEDHLAIILVTQHLVVDTNWMSRWTISLLYNLPWRCKPGFSGLRGSSRKIECVQALTLS